MRLPSAAVIIFSDIFAVHRCFLTVSMRSESNQRTSVTYRHVIMSHTMGHGMLHTRGCVIMSHTRGHVIMSNTRGHVIMSHTRGHVITLHTRGNVIMSAQTNKSVSFSKFFWHQLSNILLVISNFHILSKCIS